MLNTVFLYGINGSSSNVTFFSQLENVNAAFMSLKDMSKEESNGEND